MSQKEPITDEATPSISQVGEGYQLHQSQAFSKPQDELFAFFADPDNLEIITPPWLNFEVESSQDNPIRENTRIQYGLSFHGFPVTWRTRIKEFSKNEHFVDEMLEGPYKRWEHVHTFERINGRTVIGDQIYFEMPYGLLGDLAYTWIVRRDLIEIFSYRAKKLESIFGSGEVNE